MGNLAHSTDARASRLEREMPKYMERLIEAAICPVRGDIVLYQ